MIAPTPSEIRAAKSNQERLADAIRADRDPWHELFKAGLKMAEIAAKLARATNENREELEQANRDAGSKFGGIVSELDHCYRGVRVGHCTACDQLRRLSEPRAWEPEIVENGGPAWTVECLHCGSTIEYEPKRPRTSGGCRTPARGAEGAGGPPLRGEPQDLGEGPARPSAHSTTTKQRTT